MEQQRLLEFPINTGPYNSFINQIMQMCDRDNKSSYICVANVHMFAEAHMDKDFLSVVKNADMVTPDGKPIAWALQMLYGIHQDRVAGMDLLPDLLKEMEKQQLSVYFYGGSQDMLNKTKRYIEEKYPLLSLAGFYSPPFRELSREEENETALKINEADPDIVFVILGCPKQERWMHAMKNMVNSVMIGVGGALPVMIGLQKRAPVWMQKAGLEWVYRLLQEPGRLFKRYALTNSIFVWLVFKEWFRMKCLVPMKLSQK